MAIKKMPIATFVAELEAALKRKDGYIMGSKGQNPIILISAFTERPLSRRRINSQSACSAASV